MKVKDIMTYNTETIDSGANLVKAAKKMGALKLGSLAVCKGEDLVGMITDRDIVIRGIAEGKNPSETKVNTVMTPKVFSCLEDDDIETAAKIMEDKNVHRLVVLNSNSEQAGIISLSDIAVKGHNEHLTYEIFEHIAEPACPHR